MQNTVWERESDPADAQMLRGEQNRPALTKGVTTFTWEITKKAARHTDGMIWLQQSFQIGYTYEQTREKQYMEIK